MHLVRFCAYSISTPALQNQLFNAWERMSTQIHTFFLLFQFCISCSFQFTQAHDSKMLPFCIFPIFSPFYEHFFRNVCCYNFPPFLFPLSLLSALDGSVWLFFCLVVVFMGWVWAAISSELSIVLSQHFVLSPGRRYVTLIASNHNCCRLGRAFTHSPLLITNHDTGSKLYGLSAKQTLQLPLLITYSPQW